MRNKTRKRGGAINGRAQYSIKNKFTTLEGQCGNIVPNKLPQITQEDDFHRSIVFFKALKERRPVSLALRSLSVEEEDAFVEAWAAGLRRIPLERIEDIGAWVNWSMYEFLGLPRTVTESDLRIAYLGYAHGIEQITHTTNRRRPENNALAAFGCKRRANTRQGEFRRYLTDIVMPKRVREYSFDEEKFRGGASVSKGSGYDTPRTLDKATIVITSKQDSMVLTDAETLDVSPYRDALYIFTDTTLTYDKTTTYRVTASDLPSLRLLQDLIAGGHILDIHPRLLFLMYGDARARPLLDRIFGSGSLLGGGRLAFTSPAQAAFFWALSWEYYQNPRTVKKYFDEYPFYRVSYERKWVMMDEYYKRQTIDDEAVARVLETVDWATRGTVAAQRKQGMAVRDIFRALYEQLPMPTSAELQANVYKYLESAFIERGISESVIKPYFNGSKRLSKRSIHNMSQNNDGSNLNRGGAMPDFYKYYLPELTAAPTTCKLPASTKALEKIPALSLEQMFKRALLFWKRVQDGLPVPVNERGLPAAEEEAFIRAWQGAIAGAADRASASAGRSAQPALPAADEEAASLQFLRATDATKAQYESEFNNVAMPLSAFDCKRRPDASLSFNRLVGYIQKTGAERQYAFEANVLGTEFGTLAAGAATLSTVAFVSDRETAVQTVDGKTAVAAPASETLFIQTGAGISYQARPGKPYILPGDALLKAALPRAAFTQRAVVDLHPKVAYFLWRDPKLRNELLLPCFGEAFLPSFRAVHKSLKGYEDEFAAVYYQLCYEAAHWVPRGELIESNVAYYGGRVPGAGVFPSPRGSIIENNVNMITRSNATSPQSVITSIPASVNSYARTPATFYRLPNREKYAKIILFLQAHPTYKLPALQWATPKQGFFSRLFTRKRKPLMNTWRNLQRSKSTYSQENIQSNSVMLDSLFGAMEDQPTPPHLQLNAAKLGGTRKRRHRK